MPPKSKKPPQVGKKITKNQKGSRPGDGFQDSGNLRRQGLLQPAPIRTDLNPGKALRL